MSRRQLDEEGKRATPRQWSYYTVASTTMSIIQNKQPSLLYDLLMTNCTINSRSEARPSFYDTSRRKIGRQSIHNRVGDVFRSVNFAWFKKDLSKNSVRSNLKQIFFPYYKNELHSDRIWHHWFHPFISFFDNILKWQPSFYSHEI